MKFIQTINRKHSYIVISVRPLRGEFMPEVWSSKLGLFVYVLST